jgi:NitT/TauT family transport system permease protein
MKSAGIRLLSLFIFFGGWYGIALSGLVNLPTPFETFRTLIILLFTPENVLGRTLVEHALASLIRVLKGCLIAFSMSIPLGIIMGWFRWFGVFASTMVEMLRPIPPLAWIPLAYLLFATFDNPVQIAQIFIVFVGAFFPALINTVDGAKATPKTLIEMAQVFGARESQVLRKVVLPYTVPNIITGIRVGLGVGWMTIVAAEMVGGSGTGLGYFIIIMYEVGGRVPEIISGMIMIGLIGYGMNELLMEVEKRMLAWR